MYMERLEGVVNGRGHGKWSSGKFSLNLPFLVSLVLARSAEKESIR
jgi:hypothetical protein